MTRTYFVTGASGFIGSNFALDCARRGIQVKALVRDPEKALQKLRSIGVAVAGEERITFVKGDLLDRTSYAEHLKGCDAVYHAAAKVGYLGGREEYLRTNFQASVELARAAKEAGIGRFLYLSSQAAVRPIKWRWRDTGEKISPSTLYPSEGEMGIFHYGWSKQLAEKALLNLGDVSFIVTIFRPHVVWGVGDTTLANVLVTLARKGPLRLVNGSHQCASTHIDTLIHYSHQALYYARQSGIYHILDNSSMTMSQWLEGYTSALGLPKAQWISYHLAYFLAFIIETAGRIFRFTPPMDRFAVDGMGRSMDADISKTVQDFGLPPEIDAEKEIEQFGKWYAKINTCTDRK